MLEIIDLSQETYSGMPVFPGLPEVEITIHASHEQERGVLLRRPVSPVNVFKACEHQSIPSVGLVAA